MRTLNLDVCQKLKQLGYNGIGVYQLNMDDESYLVVKERMEDEDDLDVLLAPSPDMVTEWYQKEHGLYIWTEPAKILNGEWCCKLGKYNDRTSELDVLHTSYDNDRENAMEEIIRFANTLIEK